MTAIAQLCTLAQVKSRGLMTTTSDDIRIQGIIESILPTFNMRYSREFMPRLVESVYTFGVGSHFVGFGTHDLKSATTVILHPGESQEKTLVLDEDYSLEPLGGDAITGTYYGLVLANNIEIIGDHARRFGKSRITITGDWGCWSDVSDVPADVNEAAIETALSWLDKPASSISSLVDNSGMRSVAPPTPQTWDIPASAYRKMQPYVRISGVW